MSKRKRVPNLIRMHEQGKKITMLTAYDYTFARLFDQAGVDILLIGDSLASVIQGRETTLAVTLEEMIYHSRLVASGAEQALVVADMPFMSYQLGAKEALESAGRLVKEADVHAVKLEGGSATCAAIEEIVAAGIPVMGHVGLTPQSVHQLGGYRVQGRDPEDSARIFDEAKAIEAAGAFSVVLEGIPADLAKEITEALAIPTIGIGAGVHCSGQVLVGYDLLGLQAVPDSAPPKFVKQYAEFGSAALEAASRFIAEVQESEFPTEEHSYPGTPRLVPARRAK